MLTIGALNGKWKQYVFAEALLKQFGWNPYLLLQVINQRQTDYMNTKQKIKFIFPWIKLDKFIHLYSISLNFIATYCWVSLYFWLNQST